MQKKFLQLASFGMLFTANKFTHPMAFAYARSFSSGIQHHYASEFSTADYDRIIKENKVTVFGVTYCPYCKNTEKVLLEQGHPAYVV